MVNYNTPSEMFTNKKRTVQGLTQSSHLCNQHSSQEIELQHPEVLLAPLPFLSSLTPGVNDKQGLTLVIALRSDVNGGTCYCSREAGPA